MKFWRITVPASIIPFLSRMFEVDKAGRPAIELVNRREINAHWDRVDTEMRDHEPWEREALKFNTGPAEVIRIEDRSFDLDQFFIRNEYASARLRTAFSLGPEEIAYRPVDTSRCSGSVRAIDYEAFLPLKVANPFDPARMPGRVRPVRQEDGSLRDEWVFDPPLNPGVPKVIPIHFRPDFLPPAPLFRAMGEPRLMLATEDLADRITRAGMTGIAFEEIEGERAAAETIYRDHG